MSIADKLAAVKNAAMAAGGSLPKPPAAGASTINTGMANSLQGATAKTLLPKTPSKTSVLRPEDMIPKRTSEDQVLFHSSKATFNTVYAKQGEETRRIHFVNQYYLTNDAKVIEFLRANAKHFVLDEVSPKVSTEIKK